MSRRVGVGAEKPKKSSEAEKKLKEDVKALKKEIDTAKKENASLVEENEGLKAELEAVKAELEAEETNCSEEYDGEIYYDIYNNRKVRVHVGGTYKIYFNAKTYVLRLELQNPDTASYYCQVEWDKGNELTAKNSATPYLFEYEFVAQGKINDPYVDIPSIYPKLGMKYQLSVIDVDGFVANDIYLTESGTYILTINLKEFTLTVKRVFE